jgi:hypothetical protein
MHEEAWDWSPGEKRILQSHDFPEDALWETECAFSPDGEHVGHIFYLGEGEFQVARNGSPWEESFDNAWYLRFSPAGNLTALVSSLGAWTMFKDGQTWPEELDYIWDTQFSRDGSVIAAAARIGGQYGMMVNAEPWETLFPFATGFTLSQNGASSACSVQTRPLDEGDIETFKSGIFSVAVDGAVWPRSFINAWAPRLNGKGSRSSAVVRVPGGLETIAVDGEPWAQAFTSAWEPCFHPFDDSVLAPVRSGRHWGLARDGQLIWPAESVQVWQQRVSPVGHVGAIVAPDFGTFTVRINDWIWRTAYPVLTDLTLSPVGLRGAAIGQSPPPSDPGVAELPEHRWQVVVDDRPWPGWFDRLYRPVFSEDGASVALRAERGGKETIVCDGRIYPKGFDRVWDPVFCPDGRHLLIRAREGDSFVRLVVPLSAFTKE